MSNESEADEAADGAEEQAAETQADDVEATETEESEAGTEETGLQRGDFVTIAYTARTVEDGTLVDTTDPEVAEEEGVGEDQEFAPRTIVIGEGHVFGAVEDDLVGKEVGDTGTVTVAAAEAFGEFDEDEVRTISTDRIPEDDRYPGAHVDIDGEHGHVETVIGGRARVDFNHPLAGEDVEYEYETLDEVEDREEKAQALLDTMLDIDLEMWFETDVEEEEQLVEPDEDSEVSDEASEGGEDDEEAEPEYETVEVEKETLYIEATPQLTMNQQWMMGKQQIARQLVDQLGVDRVIVQETLGEGMGMGGLGGMMGGMGGGDIEEALEDEDIDAEELVEEIEGASE
jgi:FKBP-type peptidyl-prolyl cis-trans isomerase SlyD